MATSAELEDLYWNVRDRLLGRHFAVGNGVRANLMSIKHTLGPRPDRIDETEETVRRWTIQHRERENPLMWSGRLLTAVAVERALGHPQAESIAIAALDSVGALYRRQWGPEFDGYVSRWDPLTAENNVVINGSAFAGGFLVDPDSGAYINCVPHSDPRHVPKRPDETLERLMTPAQHDEYRALLQEQYDVGYRRWEVSMDELWGLMAVYAMMHDLIPAAAVRSRVADQASMLASYLAGHAYVLVRPVGGLNYRGAGGSLPAFEWPFDRVFQRVTGRSWPIRTDFVGAMERSGYWRLLQLPVDRFAAGVSVGGVLGAPLLLAWLGSGTPASLLVGTVLGAAGSTGPVLTPAITQALPALLSAAPRTLGLYQHRDTFDVDGSEELALAHLLLSVPPDLRFGVLMDTLAAIPETSVPNVRGFLPLAGLTAIDDPDPLVRNQYLRLMGIRRAGPDIDRTDLLYSAFASAVAVLNGMGESEEEQLVTLLQHRYDQITADGPEWLHLDDPVTESIEEALDYLAALSLAWLHARRRADAGNPVRTAGFPMPPGARPTWRGVVVPAVVVKDVEAVREALGQPPPQGNEDVDLFDGSVPVDRSPTKPPELRSTADHVLVDRAIVRVTDTDGDVFAGVTIQPGEEFEITAAGTITAPEFLAQPSDANGWYVVDDARFALHSGLDPVNAHKYALLGRLGGYFFCGTHRPRQRFLYHRSLPLYLRVNNDDSRLGGGQGEFVVTVEVFGPRRLGAQFIDAEIPATMGAGVASDMTLHFRNLGSPWEPFADVRLVLDPARSDPAWPVREMRLTMRVPPREVGTFDDGVPAPARQGTYRLAWVLMAGDVPLATSDERQITVIDGRCFELSTLISNLPAEIQAVKDDIAAATGSGRTGLRQKLARLEKQLADAKAEFAARGCT